jgi:O-antigen/teichoic acid export membrane protein
MTLSGPPVETVEAPAAPPLQVAAQPRRLAINFAFLSGGEFAAKLLTFATFSYLAHTLGPTKYGFLEFTLAVMVFFTAPADLGLGIYGAREVARNPSLARQLLREITGLRMALTLCSMVALTVFILLLNKSADMKVLLALYGVSLLGTPFLLQWFFQGHDRMQWVGAASVVRQAIFTALVFLTFRAGMSVARLGLIECASVAGLALFCSLVVKRDMGYDWPWPDMHIVRLLGHLKKSTPIGLSELAWAFMWYFCTVLLGFFYPNKSLGWFGASHRALMALHTFVYLYFFNLLPSISRCVTQPVKNLLELMDGSVRFAAWSGLYATVLLTFAAPDLLGLVYGRDFRPASGSFVVLVWMLPVAMLSGHYRYVLVAYNHQKQLLKYTAIAAVAAVALGFALEPFYSGPGAAYALLIANCLHFGMVYFAVRRLVAPIPLRRQLTAPLLSLAVSMVVSLALYRWFGSWLAVAGGSVVYVAGLVFSDGARLAAFARAVASRPASAR